MRSDSPQGETEAKMTLPLPHRNGERHEVHCSAKIAANIRRLQRQATDEGPGEEFLAALRKILRRLRRDPIRFSAIRFFVCRPGACTSARRLFGPSLFISA